MSTLNSWIDSAEISELLPFLLPQSGGNGQPGTDEDAADPVNSDSEKDSAEPVESPETPEVALESVGDGADEISTVESAELASTVGPEETIEVIDAREGVGSLPEEEVPSDSVPEVEGETAEIESEVEIPEETSDLDFDTPEAYDASAFPDAEENSPVTPARPDRQAAAVQAAVALERARTRADEVGLLKGRRDDSQEVRSDEAGHETTPAPAPAKPAVVGLDDPSEPEPAAAEALPKAPAGTFRDRLTRYASSSVELTGGSDPAITDFQSQPLYSATNGNRAGSPQAVESILRMNRLIAEISGPQNGGGRESTAHLALSDGRWLCVLTQDSAAGGVCASLQVPTPVSHGTAERLHQGLRAALSPSKD